MLENPWFIDGPEHSAATARVITYNAVGGRQGTAGPRDFLVRQTATASGSVEILPGAYTVLNTFADYQAYSGRSTGAVEVPIPASGSDGGKTWFVGIQINDPEYPNTPKPAEGEENLFTYVDFVVRSENAGENGKPWLPLAEIWVPMNTAFIENDNISSLRVLAAPREDTIVIPRPQVTGGAGMELKSKSAYPDGEWLPNSGGTEGDGPFRIPVPKWATRAQVRCEWLGVYYKNNPGYGYYWVSFGDGAGTNSPTWYTQAFKWDSGDGNTRTNWLMEQEINIRGEWRGTELAFVPRANKTSTSSYTGTVGLSAASGMVFKIRFLEEPDIEF